MPDQDYGCLAVIIPTFNEEAPAVAQLVTSVLSRLPGVHVYIVDDSTPDDARLYAKVVIEHLDGVPGAHQVRVLERQISDDRTGGLGGAVRYAMNIARSQGLKAVIVMDGDGQHPTSVLPKLAAKLDYRDLAVATRYATGGSPGDGLSLQRKVVSRLATWLAQILFPWAIGGCSDPMSGCFGVRLNAVGYFWTEGFKVLAHIMAQNPRLIRSRGEVPYTFEARTAGTSKATLHQGMQYGVGMFQLRYWIFPGPQAVPAAIPASESGAIA